MYKISRLIRAAKVHIFSLFSKNFPQNISRQTDIRPSEATSSGLRPMDEAPKT